MTRLFREHDLRQVQSLDGVWDFAFLGDVTADAIELSKIDFDDRMSVPGCFDAAPNYAGKRGLVAYRTTTMLGSDGHHRLVFGAVHHWCQVFVNGKLYREKSGGFTRFNVDFRGQSGEIEIIVLVDNRLDNGCSPLHMAYYDWYHYGGISRPVKLYSLGDLWIDNVQISTLRLDPPTVQVRVAYGNDGLAGENDLRIKIRDETLLNEKVLLKEPQGVFDRIIPLDKEALWSPGAPNIHDLHVQLGEDDLRTRFGIRQVKIDGKEIYINSEAIRLLGFNRHKFTPPVWPRTAGVPDHE